MKPRDLLKKIEDELNCRPNKGDIDRRSITDNDFLWLIFKVKNLTKALTKYADKTEFDYYHGPDEIESFCFLGTTSDGGELARKALSSVESGDEMENET